MNKAPGWLGALLERLHASAPADLLLVAPPEHALHATLPARLPATAVHPVSDPAQIPAERRAESAVVADALERLSAAAARQLVAALRDRLATHVLLIVDLQRAPLGETDLRSLGYRLLARDGEQVLFGFDLYDYKDRPDWLNAQNWAHPELWDKYRW